MFDPLWGSKVVGAAREATDKPKSSGRSRVSPNVSESAGVAEPSDPVHLLQLGGALRVVVLMLVGVHTYFSGVRGSPKSVAHRENNWEA